MKKKSSYKFIQTKFVMNKNMQEGIKNQGQNHIFWYNFFHFSF